MTPALTDVDMCPISIYGSDSAARCIERRFMSCMVAVAAALFFRAAFAETTALPPPMLNSGVTVSKALQDRRSIRDFSEADVPDRFLSGVLWAANGFNRPDKRTNATALNKQTIRIYVCKKSGAYLYDAKRNSLEKVCGDDLRAAVAGRQPFAAKAPVSLVIAADLSDEIYAKPPRNALTHYDAGIVSGNIYLYCAANGLATVCRATIDRDALKKALKLPDTVFLHLNHPIGYPATDGYSFRYPDSSVNKRLAEECVRRGIVITDWHLHIRGGMTPQMAAAREESWIVRSGALENHGREWEICDNAKLAAFVDAARAVKAGGRPLPVGIQVNDRDWFRQIDKDTLAKIDYVLADTMIMGERPDGRSNRLWEPQDIPDPEKWMERYFEHNMRILGEPISILANPTYLPACIADSYDSLWTEERMRKLVAKAFERGIALEIQAESPFPRPSFLRIAKDMGAKFSFGTNNFDARPKDLSRWLEAILWLDLGPADIWSPPKARRHMSADEDASSRRTAKSANCPLASSKAL